MIGHIRKQLARTPFVPFSIRTSNGHEYPVLTRDHAHISSRGNRVVVFTDEGAAAILGPIHINSVIEQSNGV